MPRVAEEPVLGTPARDAALTAAVLALTAVVFALVADHGILAHIQRVDDAWLRLMVSSRSVPVTAVAMLGLSLVWACSSADERALTKRAFYAQPCILSHGSLDPISAYVQPFPLFR